MKMSDRNPDMFQIQMMLLGHNPMLLTGDSASKLGIVSRILALILKAAVYTSPEVIEKTIPKVCPRKNWVQGRLCFQQASQKWARSTSHSE